MTTSGLSEVGDGIGVGSGTEDVPGGAGASLVVEDAWGI